MAGSIIGASGDGVIIMRNAFKKVLRQGKIKYSQTTKMRLRLLMARLSFGPFQKTPKNTTRLDDSQFYTRRERRVQETKQNLKR